MLSYDPAKLPSVATDTQAFLNAILVELRAIRIALEKQNANVTISAVKNSHSPVETKVARK